MRLVVGEALAGVIAEVEGLGGTVASVSGGGLEALFGAPEAHEDDPERAVRAGFRIMQLPRTIGDQAATLSVRVGIETGPAVVGPLGTRVEYAAVGEVVGAAAALQSAAKAGAVLVGPATRAAVTGVFDWGPTEHVAVVPGAKPLVASYVERPRARASGYRGQASPARQAPSLAARWSCLFSARPCGRPRRGLALSQFRRGPRPRQDPPGAGMPQALHGLGRGRNGPVAAMAGGTLRLLCVFHSVWPVPTTSVGLGRGRP